MASIDTDNVNKLFAEKAMKLPPKERIAMFLKVAASDQHQFYDSPLLKHVKLLSASEGKVECELTITKEMCNSTGNLHGGCAATLLDDLTTLPTYTIIQPGFMESGSVSRTLTCTYLRAVKAGQKVKIVAEIVSAGKTLCHVRGDLLTEDGKVAITCIHDKVARHKSKL